MEEKRFTFVKRYLTIKTKADCEIWCKEGRDKKITVTDTDNGECFIFMRKDFLYSHSDTLITMCHLLFKGENLESLEIEESDFLPNFVSKTEFEEHKTEFEEHKKSNIKDFTKNEETHTRLIKLINENNWQKESWRTLKGLRDCDLLSVGRWYRITDYTCVLTPSSSYKSGEHHYDILVMAISKNKLSETAFAVPNDNEGYFQYCNLAAWELKYCLDNDQTRFPWCGSDTDNGKGVVWWLKDEYENEAYYDFKNIMMPRYEVTATSPKQFSLDYNRIFTDKGATRENWTVASDPLYFYTFSFCAYPTLKQDYIWDLSTQGPKLEATKNYVTLKSFTISSFVFGNNKLLNNQFINGTISDFNLNCFLVIAKVEIENYEEFILRNNILDGKSYDNTFNCLISYDSKAKMSTQNNILIDSKNNVFGSYCYNNKLNSCFLISLGDSCYNNVFEVSNTSMRLASCCNNFFGLFNSFFFLSNCYYNSIGNNNRYFNMEKVNSCFIGNSIQATESSPKTISGVTQQQYWS